MITIKLAYSTVDIWSEVNYNSSMLWCIMLLLLSFEGKEGTQEAYGSSEDEQWEAHQESLYVDTLIPDSTKIIDTTQNQKDVKETITTGFFKSGIQLTVIIILLVVALFYLRKRFIV